VRKKRPTIFTVKHYMIINGKKVEINPTETDLPDRCKLAIAEITTGQRYELMGVKSGS
jgi:hypothetical protein